MALKEGKTEIVEILIRCPRVDLTCRDTQGWSLVFRAIARKESDLVKSILSQMNKTYTGTSLVRIAVEVGEEEDIRLLVDGNEGAEEDDNFIDWNETAENEDPAILWALKNDKFNIFDVLSSVNKLNLQEDSSTDLTIVCGSETFRVHRNLLCYRSPVFSAMLDSDMREAREGEINIQEMNSTTLSSMIHYIYTKKLATGWQDLDILDVARAADMYDLPGWMEVFCSGLRETTLSEEQLADMTIAGSRHRHCRQLRKIVMSKIRENKNILENQGLK